MEYRENFAQILVSWRKISQNTKMIISRNFRETTKTKIFAATLSIMPRAQNITAKSSIRKQRQNTLMIWVYNLSIMCSYWECLKWFNTYIKYILYCCKRGHSGALKKAYMSRQDKVIYRFYLLRTTILKNHSFFMGDQKNVKPVWGPLLRPKVATHMVKRHVP